MKSLRVLVLAAALVLSYVVAAVAAPVSCNKKIESFDFVVDYSGSMMMHHASMKKTKIQIAKEALQRVNDTIPQNSFMAGLHTVSPNGVIVPQGPWDRAAMGQAINTLRDDFQVFGRMTSMGDGLQTYEPFISSMQRDAALIMVTDGDNNRGVDFVETCRQIYASQRNLVIHIIDLSDTENGKANVAAVQALNPASQVVRAESLVTDDAALERFVTEVFCGEAEVLVLRGVNFAFDSYALDAKAMGILNEAAEVIKSTPNKSVLLSGWTDSKGTDAYNRVLSQNRATAVKNYLAKQGVPASRMKAFGRGKSFKYDNSNEDGRYMNRRTEIAFE
ncbi:MAG: OmpA family protein [Desulfovibrionaceae bacterium]|nr:OmpA family protein [Desulfovibrionaceae bacterium]